MIERLIRVVTSRSSVPTERRVTRPVCLARVVFPLLGLLVLLGIPRPARGQASPAGAYVASSRGEVFYWAECRAWRSLSSRNLRWFATAEEARAAGYRPSRAPGCSGPEGGMGPTPAMTGSCTVTRIIDGDTLECREASQRIRLLLIDAPELSQGSSGRQARQALERLLPPGTVAAVELDVQERDRYGRILAYLFTPTGEMVNAVLAREGFVVPLVLPPNVRYEQQIRAEARRARGRGAGLWRGSAFDCRPVDHRGGRCDHR